MTDIFEFWSQMKRGQKIHPADKKVLGRVAPEKHGFSADCLPACYTGKLRTAPVVLLYLSPGFSADDEAFSASSEGKDYYLRRWAGNEPLPDNGGEGHKWHLSRTKCFADYAVARDKIAILNIGAYHSKNVKSIPSLLALPSSRVALSWAQNVLFPEAEAGKRIVICMRSASYWGLETGGTYGKALFAPKITRNGYLAEGPKKQEIIKKVNRLLF